MWDFGRIWNGSIYHLWMDSLCQKPLLPYKDNLTYIYELSAPGTYYSYGNVF